MATRVLGVSGGPAYRCSYPNGDQVENVVIVFECRISGGDLGGQDGESVELKFFAAEERPPLGFPYPDQLFGEVIETLY